MKVLVTGASGFIGSHVCRALAENGHELLAIALPDDDLWRMQDLTNRMDIIRTTLGDTGTIRAGLQRWRPEACMHLAWYAEPGKYLDSPLNIESLQDSLRLLQALCESGCRHFVGAGSCAEYEMKDRILSETDRNDSRTLYAACKLSFQSIGAQIAKQASMQFAWGRVFYLYGPQEDRRRLVPSAIIRLRDGEPFHASAGGQIRDYLHVADVARAFVALLERQASGIYNISSGQPVTVAELLSLIAEQMGRSELIELGALPYREHEPMFVCGSNERLRALGWSPRFGLRPGLVDTIAWWLQEPAAHTGKAERRRS